LHPIRVLRAPGCRDSIRGMGKIWLAVILITGCTSESFFEAPTFEEPGDPRDTNGDGRVSLAEQLGAMGDGGDLDASDDGSVSEPDAGSDAGSDASEPIDVPDASDADSAIENQPDAEPVPCADDDGDDVCNADDQCQGRPDRDSDGNGFADACDQLLWTIEGPSPVGTSRPLAQIYVMCTGSIVLQVLVDLVDGEQSTAITGEDFDALSERLTGCDGVTAQANVAESAFVPVEPRGMVEASPLIESATINRILLLSNVEDGSYVRSLAWEIRGQTH
jgi:hypothetical protein